jgi:hypothetical protein
VSGVGDGRGGPPVGTGWEWDVTYDDGGWVKGRPLHNYTVV